MLKEKVDSVAMLFNYIIKDAENITPPKSKADSGAGTEKQLAGPLRS